MTLQKILIFGMIFALVFESLGAYIFGFYLLPSLFIGATLAFLPFSIIFLNFLITWLLGIFSFEFLAVIIGKGNWPSYDFTVHILVYVSLLLAFLYIVYDQEEK